MRRILEETGAEQYRVFIGGDKNYRFDIDPNYKANRKDVPKPEYLQDVRAYLVTEWNAEITDGIEADDAMGIAQSQRNAKIVGDAYGHFPDIDETIICSIDKDLLQVPGNHYNFVKQEHVFVDQLTGLKNFYQQLIQGDQTDNIMGYDGKARPKIPKFLQPHIDNLLECVDEIEMFNYVREMYMDDERLLRNGRLLWIQRKEGDVWEFPINKGT